MNQLEFSSKYLERKQLYEDTVACKRVDKVLAAPNIMSLPIHLYGGVTLQDILMDYSKAEDCFVKYHEEFQPDLAWGMGAMFPCGPLDALNCQYIRWPGKHFDNPNGCFQILDPEDGYMAPEEYLEYAEDPTGFMIRKILPRHYARLKPLAGLNLSDMAGQGGLYGMIPLSLPHVQDALAAMGAAGEEMIKYAQDADKIAVRLAQLGFPSATDGVSSIPFDMFNDTVRGLLNTTMDMIEYPDELLAAVNACTKITVRNIREMFKRNPNTRVVTFFVHNGMDMFMSREQFQTFYWPGMKAVVEAVIECGGIPRLYLEDKYDDKLDVFVNELPAGKVIINLINCNMERAKEMFAGKICIQGGVDGVLLQHGSKEQVIENVKHAIDILSPGGGYYLDTDVNLDLAKPENLHALFDTASNYIKY